MKGPENIRPFQIMPPVSIVATIQWDDAIARGYHRG